MLWTYSCTARPSSGISSSGDHRCSAKGWPPNAFATFSAVSPAIEFGNNSTASEVSNPCILISSKPDKVPNGLGARTAARTPVEVSTQAESSDLTELKCRGCNSCTSSIIRAVLLPLAADAIAVGSLGESLPSHIEPIAKASLSESHVAQRILNPRSINKSATERVRLVLPIPGRPVNCKFPPANNFVNKLSNSSPLPRICIGFGSGPVARLCDLSGNSSSDRFSARSLPESVKCTTVRRRAPPPIT